MRAAVCCGVGVAFLSMAGAPAFAAEMDNLQKQLRNLQTRIDQLESQQAAPPVVPAKMTRSGKKQVTLSVSGQVNRISMIADDGTLNSFFHSDNENSSTRWRFIGKAKINSDWSAGLKIEQDIGQSNNSSGVKIDFTSEDKSTSDTSFDNRQMNVYIKSKSAGKLTLGKTDMPSNNIVQIDLSGTGVVQYSGTNDIGGGFGFRTKGVLGAADGPSISTVYNQLDGLSRQNQIRYDTPKFAGFQLAVAHGQGDIWDIAARYSANYKQAGIKISAGIAYWEFGKNTNSFDSGIGGSISVLHSSGANLTFAAATQDRSGSSVDDQVSFYVKPGFQFKATSLGKTNVSVGYARADDRSVQNDEYQNIHVAVVQNIDAAALELYAFWEINILDRDGEDFENINIGGIGARMKF
ncbi:MAG: porin [Proteobacteria bacterium]|nr:porin [Pseudomonadota bacterium]